METKANEYACRAAMLLIAAAIAEGGKVDVRGALKAATDIPEDRLDFAASEISQMVEPMKLAVPVLVALAELTGEPLAKMLDETIGDATWIDDDKRDMTLRAFRDKGDQGEEPLVTIKTKLKAAND